ncbi:hypothetical protein UFOVP1304_29 [uncultured Caudovirales phage]|uniref:Uncharacterized protein n=1 Tax=uncultured Caudovirales phage TaxID=2100421 RepID=A0A6J5RY68_9CAUD|nr:hypothetical protein UFOVP1304_29 [uncultured Caudovirales phage]
MAAIGIKAFGGLKPLASPLLLASGDATAAQNVRLVSGSLVPLKATTTLQALSKIAPQTIFRYGTSSAETNYWLEFLSDTDIINSPVPNDAFGRVYWTDGGTARYATNTQILSGVIYPGASHVLGIPAPTQVPVVTGSAPADPADAEARVYTYTYVSAYGEEGPPSAPTAVASIDPTVAVSLAGMSTVPSGEYNIISKRIYRSSTVGISAQYQYVTEIPVANTTYSDTKSQSELGEVLPSTTWVGPPTGLKGLKMMANGVAIGFKENTVYLSEPSLPHAWPNQYPVDLQIVGLSPFRQSVAILTTGHPYLMTGVDPTAMSLERLEFPHACLSKQSIVDTGDGCLYASADGIVSVGAGGMKIVSEQLFDRAQWQAYNPSSMKAFFHDSRYHVLYTTSGGARGMLIFDYSGQGAILTTSNLNAATAITAGYSDARTDTLYLAQGTNIVRFNLSSSALTATWKTGIYRLIRPVSFTCGMVRAAAYPVTLRIYPDSRSVIVKNVTSQDAFRLPAGFRASNWQFEIETTTEVTMFAIATSTLELQQMS